MLQQYFEHGSRSSAQGNFDYADRMFTQCVVDDPSNPIYVGSFIGNLHKKYNNNKTGAKLASVRGAAIKTSVKNSARKKDWKVVITGGLEMLTLNPWEVSVLWEMANACEQLRFDECQVIYLSSAIDADMREPEAIRRLARALARQGKYDWAIGCWTRVLQAKPNDEEAQREISFHAEGEGSARALTSPEQQLERKIAKEPVNLWLYFELADLYLHQERFEKVGSVLERALAASGASQRDPEMLKQALYRAGVFAMDQLIDIEKAERYLTTLARLEFGYKDVSERLEKLRKRRENGRM